MRLLFGSGLFGGLAALALAGPTDDAIVAAMRLSEQTSYSWVSTVADDARTYDIHGQTVRGGYTRVRMPVINSVRRQLGRSVTDTQIELIFLGNVDCVIETDDGWRRPDELAALEANRTRGATGEGVVVTRSPVDLPAITFPRLPPPRPRKDGPPRPYSNLQLAISHPHEDLGVIVGSHESFRVEGSRVTGTLTDRGAQLLLVRDGQTAVTPVRASGEFTLWVHDGLVVRYQVKLQGTLQVQGTSATRTVTVAQTTDTVIKAVGSTQPDVPDEARAKLSR